MTNKQWHEAFAAMGIHRTQFAALLRVEDRTVRRWMSGEHELPRAVEILIDLLRRRKITLEDLR